ncbi:MAG TPA: ATP-dependent DNA ligase [Candidatus Sulfotelmatobacter sp.]
MKKFAETCEAIAATTKKLQKVAIVAAYLNSCPPQTAALSAVFLTGRPFPVAEESTLQVGGSLLWRQIAELSGKPEEEVTSAYRRHGDLGSVAADILPQKPDQALQVREVAGYFRQIAKARGAAAKASLVRELLNRATRLDAKYIVKIMTGDLRIGLKESLVEEAIAKAYGAPTALVQRANMLLGDVGETLKLALDGRLAESTMRLFHPLGFMLASPVESTEDGLSYFTEVAVEDKYDGIRAQAHVSGDQVRFYSRTRDEITESFPELPEVLAGLQADAILDGEIVAWEFPYHQPPAQEVIDRTISKMTEEQSEEKALELGRARPFSVLQKRLGRKKVSDKMLRETPVAFLVFDTLYANGKILIDEPLRERAFILDELMSKVGEFAGGVRARRESPQGQFVFESEERNSQVNIIRAPVFRASSPQELEELFVAARARGNEGLMIKDLNSRYSPGKRGKSWLKMKRELATLDVVVTAAEFGHGKRIGVLSDYTFAVWDGDRLVNIGKAYSGLTDVEIAEMTHWFMEHTIEDQGFRRTVEPKIVLEVAFNNMMRSDRHNSGYALRFPRIVRLRTDKSPEEADTIERVQEVFENQNS